MFQKYFTTAALVGSALATPYYVFDSTAYTNTSIGYGTYNINWIPAYVCNPLVVNGQVPSKQDWQVIVAQWAVYPGYPLVLDCENIYLDSPSTAAANLAAMEALQTWAAEILPANQLIGWYGLAGNTPLSLYGYYQSLIANHSNHAFFPSAYTYSSSLRTWNSSLKSVIAQAQAIDESLPIWPFMWPQYHNSPYAFYPVSLWKSQLKALEADSDVDGFVIWGGKNHAVCNDTCQTIASTEPWLNATRTYLSALYGIFNGLPEVRGGQLFMGS